MSFKSLGRNCPICDGARRDCRENLNTGMIHCRDGNANPGGQWRYIKDDANGFGMWIWDDGGNGTDNRANRPTYAPKEPTAPAVASLPVADRDRAYLRMGGLAVPHRIDIRKRPHVTDQEIDALVSDGLLFTWHGGQTVAGAGVGLPGVDGDGRLMGRETWAIGIPNLQGQIAGVQLRNPEGGYFWASRPNHGGATPHVDGELPLGIYGTPRDGVAEFDEGYFKTALTHVRYGGLHFGMSGGQWANAPKQLRAALEFHGITQAVLNADGGAIANPAVLLQYQRLATLLQDWDIPLSVRWWGQTTKADGDVDEIAHEVFHGAKLLTWEEYLAMGECKIPKGNRPRKARKARKAKPSTDTLAPWLSLADTLGVAHDGTEDGIRAAIEAHCRPRKINPDRIIVNGPDGFSLDDLQWLASVDGLVLVTGETGAGKTELASQVVRHQGEQWQGIASTSSTRNLAGGNGLRLYGAKFNAEVLNPASCSLPIESIWKLTGEKFDAYFQDEPDAQYPRLLEGRLGNNSQDLNLNTAKRMHRKTPLVCLLNAYMSPITVDTARHLSDGRPLTIVELQRPRPTVGTGYTLYQDAEYTDENGDPATAPADMAIMQAIVDAGKKASTDGGEILVLVGGRENAKALQRALRKAKVTSALRDGKYTFKGILQGFAANPTAVPTVGSQPATVTIVTRVAETGADMRHPYRSVFCWLSPGQGLESAYQFISRSRALLSGECPELHLYIPSSRFISPDQMDPSWHLENIKASNRYYLSLLNGTHGETLEAIQEKIDTLETEFSLLARYRAEQAQQQFFCIPYLQDRLNGLGWQCRGMVSGDVDSQARTKFKSLKRKAQVATAFAQAHGYRTIGEYSESRQYQIEDDNEQGFVVNCYRRKLALARAYPTSPLEDTAFHLALIDKPRLEPQTKILGVVLLAQQPEYLELLGNLQTQNRMSLLSLGRSHGPLTLLHKLQRAPGIDLACLNIGLLLGRHPFIRQLIQNADTQAWDLDGDDLRSLATLIREHAPTLANFSKRYLNYAFDWEENSDVALVNKLLSNVLGLDVTRAGQYRAKGRRFKQYHFTITEDALSKQDEPTATTIKTAWGYHWAMGASSAMGWMKSIQNAGLGGVTLNPEVSDLLLKFRVTPQEDPPPETDLDLPEPETAPPETPIRHPRTGLIATLLEVECSDLWKIRWPDGATSMVGASEWEVAA